MDELLETIPDRKDIEVILIDDRSTLPYIPSRTFEYASIRIVKNTPGKKYAGTARNQGIEIAQGEWIVFADSDDQFTSGFEPILEQVIKKGSQTDQFLFMMASFGNEIDKQNRHLLTHNVITRFRDTQDPKVLTKHHCSPGRIIRREHIHKHNLRYDEKRYAEDSIFTTRLAVSEPRTIVLHIEGYKIRENETSETRKTTKEAIRDRIQAVIDREKVLREKGWHSQTVGILPAAKQGLRTYPFYTLRLIIKGILNGASLLNTRDFLSRKFS